MNRRELRVVPTLPFLNSSTSFDDAEYVIVGFPYDGTSTYRSGSRFAPDAIRKASLNLEPYSIRSRVSVDDLRICDLGNLEVTMDTETSLEGLHDVVSMIIKANRIPTTVGGEHTQTLGIIRAFSREITVFDFDAHADLRHSFMGKKLSHATVMRRICELLGPDNLVQIGTRALCKEEVEYIERTGVRTITVLDIHERESAAVDLIESLSESADQIYITVDMDVLDPAYAPAVANPEPEGIDVPTLLDLITLIPRGKITGFDLAECVPQYDKGITALEAAKIVMELLCHHARR
ncbi:MAG: agmatinase [Candidatus Bathyarchaeia archaeon]